MKRTMLSLGVIVGAMFLAAPEASAADRHNRFGFNFGFGFDGGFFRFGTRAPYCPPPVVVAPCAPPVRIAPIRHVHHRIPIYRQVWVPAQYGQTFCGYNVWGRPIYRTVCVSAAHYETVVSGYRCDGCGCGL